MSQDFTDEYRFWSHVKKAYPDFYRDFEKENEKLRSRQRARGECVCPRRKSNLCFGDCVSCQFRSYYPVDIDELEPSDEGRAVERTENQMLIHEALNFIAREYGSKWPEVFRMRAMGFTLEEICSALGFKRSTLDENIRKIQKDMRDRFGDF